MHHKWQPCTEAASVGAGTTTAATEVLEAGGQEQVKIGPQTKLPNPKHKASQEAGAQSTQTTHQTVCAFNITSTDAGHIFAESHMTAHGNNIQ